MARHEDLFDRANAGTLGTDWTNRAGAMGISSNQAYPVTTNLNNYASYDTPMSGDNMAVSIEIGTKVGTLTDSMRILLGCNTNGYGKALALAPTNDTISIYDFADWAMSGTALDSDTSVPMGAGDVVTFRRVGSLYTVLFNGDLVSGLSYSSSSGIDENHRLVGIGAYSNPTAGNYRKINSFWAEDIGGSFFAMF